MEVLTRAVRRARLTKQAPPSRRPYQRIIRRLNPPLPRRLCLRAWGFSSKPGGEGAARGYSSRPAGVEGGNGDTRDLVTTVEDYAAQAEEEEARRLLFLRLRQVLETKDFAQTMTSKGLILPPPFSSDDIARYSGLFLRACGTSTLPLKTLGFLLGPNTSPAKTIAAMELMSGSFAIFVQDFMAEAEKNETVSSVNTPLHDVKTHSHSSIPTPAATAQTPAAQQQHHHFPCLPPLNEDARLGRFGDMGSPEHWYPLARSMPRRKVVLHVGPTNSGKTYRAIKALADAKSGIFCGPLRLLAWEVYEKLNTMGVPCTLVTGQEKEIAVGANHVSCTVEMCDLDRRVDVCVIDEMQIIGSSDRGWAWTQALLG